MHLTHFTDLRVYQACRVLSQRIFALTQEWPVEERYSLIDQIRRASRSTGANLAEAWGKRRYEAHFCSKLSDADAENHETGHWLICAQDCGYLTATQFDELVLAKQEIGKMIGAVLQNPAPFILK